MRKKWPQFPPPMWGEEGSTKPWNTLGRVDAGVMLIWMNLSGVDTRLESADSGQRSPSRQNLAHRHRRASLKCPLPIHVDRLRHACPENDPSNGAMSELLVCSVTSYVFSMTIPNPMVILRGFVPKTPTTRQVYSYRKASIGFSIAAFRAG